MDKTADELAYERYKAGEYTYEEYVDVCRQEECEPKTDNRNGPTVKIGTSVFFTYDGEEYEREIESVKTYKNYSWIGDLGFGGNVMFLVHGNLDEHGEPVMEGLAIQVDSTDGGSIHEYVRDGITYKEN